MKTGTILAISGNEITVKMHCLSACAQCSQHHLCPLESTNKEVKIIAPSNQQYQIGQTVNVDIAPRSIFLCLILAYVIPLMLLLSIVIIGAISEWTDLASAIIALLSLIPYYVLLFFLNSRLKKHLDVKIMENSVD